MSNALVITNNVAITGFRYQDAAGKVSVRTIGTRERLTDKNGNVYYRALDLGANGVRHFRLSGISQVVSY